MDILVAGAGIGGLSAALALAKTGATVSIFERTRELRTAGAGIQLGPNATRILRDLNVFDGLQPLAFAPEAIRVRSARTGATLALMPLTDAETRWGAPYLVVHRADLQYALQQAVAEVPSISLTLDAGVTGFGTTGDGVRVSIKERGILRTLEGTALIGADGIHSTIRARLLGGSDTPRETGRTAWRTLIPAASLPDAFRAPETGLWLGADAHLVHYFVSGGRVLNVIAVSKDKADQAESDFWAASGDPQRIAARFARWPREVQELIAAAPHWTTYPLADRDPLPNWNAGPVALLGDAAHPVLPFLAQGGAMAIEDAVALGTALRKDQDPTIAFARYSQERVARATRVQMASRELGRVYHMRGVAGLARDAGLRLLGGARLINRYDWLYGFRAGEA